MIHLSIDLLESLVKLSIGVLIDESTYLNYVIFCSNIP